MHSGLILSKRKYSKILKLNDLRQKSQNDLDLLNSKRLKSTDKCCISRSITATEKCTFSAFPIHKPKGIKEVKVISGSTCSCRDPDATNGSREKKFLKMFTIYGHEGPF